MLRASLERRLGPVDASAIIVSNVIGSGILIVPAIVARLIPNPLAILAVWLIGGLLAFAGAMAYAELATLRSRAGGEYVYLREAFGPLVGFLSGWTSFIAGFSGAIAAGAVGVSSYLGRFIPFAADTTELVAMALPFGMLTVTRQDLTALSVIVVLSVIHIIGLGPGRVVQNVLSLSKVLILIMFVLLGLVFGQGTAENFSIARPVPAANWLVALIPVMFSYSGWNAAAYVAEEVRDPARNLPIALGLGTAIVVVVYLAMNLLYLYAFPVEELGSLQIRVVDATAARLFGGAVATALAAATVVMVAASISAMIVAGPRVYFAMARDGLFFGAAARVHPRFRTPAVAIVAQAVWSSLLVLSGTFIQLVEFTGFSIVLFAGLAVVTLFVLRRRLPFEPRPFLAWGYPVAPGLFALFSMAMVVNAIWRTPGPAAAGLVVILAGVPVYMLLKHWKQLDKDK